MDTRPDFKNSGFDSPHPEDVRQVVSDMIDELMRLDVSVANYSRLIQSPVLVNSVKAYTLVEEICQKYVGRLLPVKGTTTSHKISEVSNLPSIQRLQHIFFCRWISPAVSMPRILAGL